MINITHHITDRQNIITSRFSIIMLCLLIITLSLLNITFLTGTILGISISTTSALSYQNSTDVSFTFDPILSISVSPDFITIPTIAPGTTATSNIITVNVSTNTAYGYSLLASVGNNTQYDTSDLIHSDSTIDSTFTSISPTASLSSLTDDNTWGYSTSLDNGSTWSTYHGLPLYSTVDNNTSTTSPALLIDTTSPADSKSISFRIAARASSTQPSGTYSNVINFYAVGKPEPYTINRLRYMQDLKDLAGTDKQSVLDSMAEGQQYILKDSRDQKDYYISKLADGNIWMTQNLDLDIDSTKTYMSTDTDVPSDWIPIFDTVTTTTWIKNYYIPYSYDPGNLYWNGVVTSSDGTLENRTSDTGDPHYHIGNYYNWTAAVAINNSAPNSTNYQDMDQSICPAGWRLPTYSGNKSFSDLKDAEGPDFISSNKFVYGGSWNGSTSNVGKQGLYWSSVVQDEVYSYGLNIYSNNSSPQNHSARGNGFFVRCVNR